MLRVGIAGIGTIAEVYIRQFLCGGIQGGTLVALSSRSLSHMEEVSQSLGLTGVALYTSYEEMLAQAGLDVVLICTPHRLHVPMAIQAVEAGIHPLLEKPVAADAAQGTRLLQVLQAHPACRAGVLYCHRTNPLFQYIKTLLDNGTLGALKRVTWLATQWYRTPAYHTSGSWRSSWSGEGGGLLMNQATHQLDLLTWLCGPPSQVTALCEFGRERPISVETDATLHLRYPNGALGQFIASSREFPGTNRLELSGSQGQLILEDEHTLTLRTLEQDERDFARTTQSFFGPISFQEQITTFPVYDNSVKQAAIVTDFLQAVAQGTQPLCPVDQALVSLQVMNAAYLSAWSGTSVSFPPPDGQLTRALEERCRLEQLQS